MKIRVLHDPRESLRNVLLEPGAAIGQGHHLVRVFNPHRFALATQLMFDRGQIDQAAHVSRSALRGLCGPRIVAKDKGHQWHATLGGFRVWTLLPHRNRIETDIRGGLSVRIRRPFPRLIRTERFARRAARSPHRPTPPIEITYFFYVHTQNAKYTRQG